MLSCVSIPYLQTSDRHDSITACGCHSSWSVRQRYMLYDIICIDNCSGGSYCGLCGICCGGGLMSGGVVRWRWLDCVSLQWSGENLIQCINARLDPSESILDALTFLPCGMVLLQVDGKFREDGCTVDVLAPLNCQRIKVTSKSRARPSLSCAKASSVYNEFSALPWIGSSGS